MRRPLIFPFIGLGTGIIIGNYIDFSCNILLIALIFSCTSLFLFMRKQWWTAVFLLVCLITLIIGILNIQKQQYLGNTDRHISKHVNSGLKVVEGIIDESPLYYANKKILTVHCIRLLENGVYIPVTGHVRLILSGDLNFSYGDFVRFQSVLKKISSFNNPGSFDYERYLRRQGIYATGFIADYSRIVLLRKNSASNIRRWLESFRMYLKRIIYNNAPSPQREIIEAMSLGNQNEIPAAIRDSFNKTGTSHILSISGLHISMVAATAFFFISIILKTSEYLMLKLNVIKLSAAVAFILVLIYSLIAGMSITVIRAALMAGVFLFALILDKQRDLYNTIALAGLIILIISPESLFDISFQLSFLAVLAIIYTIPRLVDIPHQDFSVFPGWIRIPLRYVYTSILVCLAATAGTMPFIVFYFNRVSLMTIIANLITVPLLGTLTLAIVMIVLLTSFLSPAIAGFFVKLASFFVQISVDVINKLASVSWSTVNITKPNIPEIIVFYLFIMLLLKFIQDRKKTGMKKEQGYLMRNPLVFKYAIISMVIFFIGDAIYLSLNDKLSRNLRVTAIDVGQGASVLVRLPGGKNMLIDGGGFADSSFDVGKMVIAPYLYHERISKIDTVILTHPHPDHLLGLFYILNNFDVREFWSTDAVGDDENYPILQKILREQKIKRFTITTDALIKKNGNVEIIFLWPSRSVADVNNLSDKAINNTSLVFKIKYGQISFLITGDIGSDVENTLIRSGKNLNCDVLFIPHHGSNHSSSMNFIRNTVCRYAIISAGKDNVFRHPHSQTLVRYQEAQCQILRTDKDGAITMTTDGTKLYMESFIKQR
ncbi:MAG: ComEC family competence protein [Smithella sp. PtaU1.Bin162]|nr:MAG: ComEC family competence protein [Smithella sp. PtaU1.Bin162]